MTIFTYVRQKGTQNSEKLPKRTTALEEIEKKKSVKTQYKVYVLFKLWALNG